MVLLPERGNMTRKLARIALWTLFLVGCHPHHPGNAVVAVTAESLLFGGEPCRADADCPVERCSLGMCVGFLMNAVEAVRIAQHERLRQAARDPILRTRLVAVLAQVLEDAQGDPFLRARAAHALSAVPAAEAAPILDRRLADPEEPVRLQAARSLHRLGDPRGTEGLRGFLAHGSAAVRALARYALDQEPRAITASE